MKHIVKFETSSTRDMDTPLYYSVPSGKNSTSGRGLVVRRNTKLRDFDDFLQSCNEVLPLIKGLEIRNDCKENQKLMSKQPDCLTSRWNRYATELLDQNRDYPGFSENGEFISKKARIVCNPESSVRRKRHQEK